MSNIKEIDGVFVNLDRVLYITVVPDNYSVRFVSVKDGGTYHIDGRVNYLNSLMVKKRIRQILEEQNSDKILIESRRPYDEARLLKTIDELEISVRSYNCLKNENIDYVGDLVVKTEAEVLKIPNFGRKSLKELKSNLKAIGLRFGMELPDGYRTREEIERRRKELSE